MPSGITGQRYQGSVLVLPDRTLAWPLSDIAALSLDDLAPLKDAHPPVELLIVGTGASPAWLDPALVAALRDWGMVVDAMATGAACRTYNVLLLEDRRVAAALIAIE